MKYSIFCVLLLSLVLVNSACKKEAVPEPKLEITVDNLVGEWEIYEIVNPDNVINFGTGVTYEFGETYTSGLRIINDTSLVYVGVDQPAKWELLQGDTFRLFHNYSDDVQDYFIYRLDKKELWLSDLVIDGEFIGGAKFSKKD